MSGPTVLVGAGSSGAVIAARMTERSDREVELVEAGPDYADPSALPSDLRDGTRNSMRRHDWGYVLRPTPGQILFDFPRGKVVGGSSAVNTCIALRGQPHDYDEWEALGLPGWGWADCLRAFKRLEDDLDVHNEWHGRGGPVPIRRHPRHELVPWQAAFVDACGRLGFERCADHNDPTTTGCGPHAMNKIDGVRMSAARCYLTPAVRRRDNLRLRARTLVRRVLFENRRVRGLEVETDGKVEVIVADRVVLCAGAIGTPSILLRSGIGPRASVERIGVDLVSEVPAVGARLLDHPGAAMILLARWGVSKVSHPLIQALLRFTSQGSAYPNDMQVQPGSMLPLIPGLPLPTVTMMCQVGKPRGVCTFELRSADPRARPWIEGNFLVDDADRARAVEAIEIAYQAVRSPEMTGLARFLWPSERVLMRRSAIDGWIRKSCGSGYHPAGTVPMGGEGDAGAAVDARGRVRGVDGLLVADASIMPTIPSANTNLPTLMIGERFGEWLRDGAI